MTIPTKTIPTQNQGGRAAKEFTPDQIEYVRANHEYRTQAEIMTHLGLTRHHMKMLYRHLGLALGKSAKKPFNRANCLENYWMKKEGDQLFDVHEMEWL